MKNLKISKKLSISYAVVLLLLIISMVFSIATLRNIGAQVKTFYNGPFIAQSSANTIDMRFEQMQKSVYRAISNSDLDITQDALTDAKNAASIIQEQLTIVKEHFMGDKQILTNLESALAELAPMREQVLQLASENKNAEAAAYMESHNIPVIQKAQAEITELINDAGARGEALIVSLNSAQLTSTIILTVLSIASVIISLAFAFYITKSITKPVAEIESAASKLANGNLDVSIQYESKDELGGLAHSMRTTVTNLKAYIMDIGRGMAGLAKGDLTVQPAVDYKGDFIDLQNNMQALIDALNDTLAQINQSADQVSSGSEQVSGSAQALSQGATEQASSVEELAATISEISHQVQGNAENAEQASAKANAVGVEMTSSNEQMKKMIDAMAEISNSSSEIGKIIKTIEDIAFQTNILALNAAVEAARAGAAGKGFAVVADEVRNLASKSAEASKNTAALIEGSLKAVENGTQIADDTAKSLLSAVEGARVVTETINKISDASKAQAESIAQVTQGVDQISAVVQTNSATAEESAAASEELSSQAQMLKTLVSRFNLKGGAAVTSQAVLPHPTGAMNHPAALQSGIELY